MSAAVVKLPSAARRQVQQPQNKEGRAARASFRQQQAVAFDYRHHTRREADAIAEAIHPMTAERWLLLAMLHVMPADTFDRLAAFGVHGHPAIRGLMKLAKGGAGLNLDVMTALEGLGK